MEGSNFELSGLEEGPHRRRRRKKIIEIDGYSLSLSLSFWKESGKKKKKNRAKERITFSTPNCWQVWWEESERNIKQGRRWVTPRLKITEYPNCLQYHVSLSNFLSCDPQGRRGLYIMVPKSQDDRRFRDVWGFFWHLNANTHRLMSWLVNGHFDGLHMGPRTST